MREVIDIFSVGLDYVALVDARDLHVGLGVVGGRVGRRVNAVELGGGPGGVSPYAAVAVFIKVIGVSYVRVRGDRLVDGGVILGVHDGEIIAVLRPHHRGYHRGGDKGEAGRDGRDFKGVFREEGGKPLRKLLLHGALLGVFNQLLLEAV